MVLLDWLWKQGSRPQNIVFLGLLLGLAGIVLLVDPTTLLQGDSVNVPIALLVLLGALSWATGSIYGRTADLPANPFMTTAMQMLGGGVLLTIASLFFGEWRHFDVTLLSLRSFTAWTYLVTFGAFIAFSAYVWLLKHTTAARAATYAYVNPVVAVFLGWALADEPLNLRILVAVVLLVTAVVLITRHRRSKPRQRLRKVKQPAPAQAAPSVPPNEAVLVETKP
jgi:drug/metabolite transporter (DMT)-like permease